MTNSTNIHTPLIGNWSEQKARLKAKFAALMAADLHSDSASKDEISGNVQMKRGKSKEEIARIIGTL